MRDQVLFIIEDDITDETILAALAAIQAYERGAILKNKSWNKIHKQDVVLDLEIDIILNKRYQFIFKNCLTFVGSFYDKQINIKDLNLFKNYTYICQMSLFVAEMIAEHTNKPLASALGILIGAEADSLPDVSGLVSETQKSNRLYVEDFSLVKRCVNLDLPAGSFHYNFVSSLEELINIVANSAGVVGYSSFATYLSCALQKPTVEIQFNKLLYKWSNKNYICLSEDDDYALIKGFKQCQTLVIEG